MRIINLYAQNVKSIKVVDITPSKDGAIILEGRNAQGKTTILDTILYTLCGEKMIPDNVIRTGETEATIRITLDDDVVITRTFKDTGTTKLVIDNADGSRIMAPQTWLDARLGKLSFDPLAFSRLDKKARLEEIKRITGLNFSEVESNYAVAFEKRKLANRDVDTYSAQLKEYATLKAPDENVRDIAEIRAEIDKQRASAKVVSDKNDEIAKANYMLAQSNENTRLKISKLESEFRTCDRRVIEMNERIETLKKEILLSEGIIINLKSDADKMKAETIELTSTIKTLAPLNELPVFEDLNPALDKALAYKDVADKLTQKSKIETSLKTAKETVVAFEKEMDSLKQTKSDMIKNAKMPVAGLSMTKDDVTFNGIAFDEISDAQKIQVSMSIAVAQNPTLRIGRIKEGSLLDDNMLKAIVDAAKEKDFQLWIERVANSPSGNAIYIEAGEIKRKEGNNG